MAAPHRQTSRRVTRIALAALAAAAALAAGPIAAPAAAWGPASAGSPPVLAEAAATGTPGDDTGDNTFLPEEQNLDDCVGLLQRPGCGSEARGGWRQYMTMGVLALGLAFIGWRIARGIRARDLVVNAGVPGSTAGEAAGTAGERTGDAANDR